MGFFQPRLFQQTFGNCYSGQQAKTQLAQKQDRW